VQGVDERFQPRPRGPRARTPARPFHELLAEHPHHDERWDPSETSRFGALACRLWAGLRAFEEVR
jgi:hypothetical protein